MREGRSASPFRAGGQTVQEDNTLDLVKLLNQLPGAAAQGLIWGLMAIGVYITYRILDIADLTVDGSMATGGAVAVVLIMNGWNCWAAVLAAFAAGMIAGLVTGVFHTTMGIPAILAGILTQLGLYSVNLRIMGGANLPASARKYTLALSSVNVGRASFSNPIFIMLLVAAAVICLMYIFFGTEFGCSLRAIGANGQMARAQGISTGYGKVVGLMLSNGMVAMSGGLLSQYQGFADISQGRGAIVIGLRNFALKLLAVTIGAILYYLVIQAVLWLGLNTDDLKLFTALVVAVFLAVPYWNNRVKAAGHRRGGKADA